MLKEIHEQPDVIRNTLAGRISPSCDAVIWEDNCVDPNLITDCSKVVFLACGTAWHAGLVGKRLFESLAKVPVEIEIASEYRYKELLIAPNTVVIPITQSGETADTLEALRIAKRHGATILSLVNATGSTIARESDSVVYLRAGLEIGVASTKAYTAMVAALSLLAIDFGLKRGTLPPDDARTLLSELQTVPELIQTLLDDQGVILQCASDERYRDAHSALFLGRGYNLPTALEGALKLKEISYIHAEGYGAGEMKHGAIALVTDKLPSVFIATRSATRDKVISNIQEVRARNGIVLAIATEGDTEIVQHSDEVIYIPDCLEALSPLLAVIPLQLLAYYISVNRGCDVDQPRNLAKSVTVE